MPRLPDDTQRLFIVGKTGSGKSQAGLWHLALRHWDEMPWTIFDFKDDEQIKSNVPHKQINLGTVPTQPGIYRIVCLPNQKDEINEHIWKIWAQGNHGIFVDEGLAVVGMDSIDAINKQGRSKHIPVIMLYQRPVGMRNVSVLSETEYLQVFKLKLDRDYDSVAETVSDELRPAVYAVRAMPKYHSLWIDDDAGTATRISPVPPIDTIKKMFQAKMQLLEKGYESERHRGLLIV